jgi:hypothetical protein
MQVSYPLFLKEAKMDFDSCYLKGLGHGIELIGIFVQKIDTLVLGLNKRLY